MSTNPKYNAILEREFRAAAKLSPDAQVVVDFPEEEVICITVNGKKWVMEIGSDDDYFWFRDDTGDVVRFDFPDDWDEVDQS